MGGRVRPAGVQINVVALGQTPTEVTKSMGDMLDTFAAASSLGRPNEPDGCPRDRLPGREEARLVTGTVLAVTPPRRYSLTIHVSANRRRSTGPR